MQRWRKAAQNAIEAKLAREKPKPAEEREWKRALETSRGFPVHAFAHDSSYYRNALPISQFFEGTRLPLSPRLRWKLDRFREQMSHIFGGGRKENARPRLCPACGTLVGSTATRCHQCGASMTFSLAAASKTLSRLMPTSSPVTYGILTMCCVLYGMSLLWTARISGLQPPPSGIAGLFQLGAINGEVLLRMGQSLPLFGVYFRTPSGIAFLPGDFAQPWRLVTAVFLHASLLHIAFNMWVLMDIGPLIEELYGSARYLCIFVVTGIGGYVLSGAMGTHFSVGASGALLGLIGVLLSLTIGRRSPMLQELRGQLVRWLIYIAVIGLIPGTHIDNMAHLGGFLCGFGLGKLMSEREPVTPQERRSAQLMGWATALVVAASFTMMILWHPVM
jgi:rhomboid protease GluP